MSVQRQIEILNSIVSVMHESAQDGYDTMRCEFEYKSSMSGWSAGAKFRYTHSGKSVSDFLCNRFTVYDMLHELHELMKEKTGGDWNTLVIEVGEDGRATTKFSY